MQPAASRWTRAGIQALRGLVHLATRSGFVPLAPPAFAALRELNARRYASGRHGATRAGSRGNVIGLRGDELARRVGDVGQPGAGGFAGLRQPGPVA